MLPPHIGIWIKPEDRNIWANTGLWDDAVITGEGDEIAIYYFSDKNESKPNQPEGRPSGIILKSYD